MDTKKKRIFAILLTLVTLTVMMTAATFAEEEPLVNFYFYLKIGDPLAIANYEWVSIDPADREVTPIIENGRTLVPIRFIADNMGAITSWDQGTRTVTISRLAIPEKGYFPAQEENSVKLTIGESSMFVNGKEISLDQPAIVKNGRTLVPIRAIAEAFNLYVEYEPKEKAVYIDSYRLFPEKLTILKLGDQMPFKISVPEATVKDKLTFDEEYRADLQGWRSVTKVFCYPEDIFTCSMRVDIFDTTAFHTTLEEEFDYFVSSYYIQNGYLKEMEPKVKKLEETDTYILGQLDFKYSGPDTYEYGTRTYVYITISDSKVGMASFMGSPEDLEMNEEHCLDLIKSFKLL